MKRSIEYVDCPHTEPLKKYPSYIGLTDVPSYMLLSCMFYMDNISLMDFICSCKYIHGVFEGVACESVERRRLDILNGVVSDARLPLLKLFQSDRMVTYDSYFREKSIVSWPPKYYHDEKKFSTVIDVSEARPWREISNSVKDIQPRSGRDLSLEPYGMITQADTYYLSFNDVVKRSYMAIDVAGVATERTYEVTPDFYNNCDSYISYKHSYTDNPRVKRRSMSENIVRFFKHPSQMSYDDFDQRFKNVVLGDLGRAIVYECAFEHNKTTTTRERFVVAGGSLLHALTHCGCQDIDLFVIRNGESIDVCSKAVRDILQKFETLAKSRYNIMKSQTTINICPDGCEFNHDYLRVDSHINIQIVLLDYDTIEELLLFFDLDCCRLAFDGGEVYTTPECLRSLKYKINFLPRIESNTEINFYRAKKYGRRGFCTFITPFAHPLLHAMHADFLVERVRDRITDEYDSTQSGWNPASEFYVNWCFKTASSTNSFDVDSSEYLYPLVLRNVNYDFVALCISNGLLAALDILSGQLVRTTGCYIYKIPPKHKLNSGLIKLQKTPTLYTKEIVAHALANDAYIFVETPSELFKSITETELSSLMSNKYTKSHLRRKYNISYCNNCGVYFYVPIEHIHTCETEITETEQICAKCKINAT